MWHKRRPLPLTIRVMLFVALAFCVSLALIGTLVVYSIEHHFTEQDADEINVMVRSIKKVLINSRDDDNDKSLKEALSHAISGHHGVYYQVERDGTLLYSTPDIDFRRATSEFPIIENISRDNLRTWNSEGKGFRGVVVAAINRAQVFRITSAIDINFHQHFLRRFKQSLTLIILGAAAFTLLAVWLSIYQGLKPLRGLSDKMGFVQTNKLDLRLDPLTVPAELKTLVQSFNHMIERLEGGFIRLSHFSTDIAHELRTPLTNIATQTQVGLSKTRNAEEYRELLYSNLEELERLTKMVGDMLWLAKSENGLLKLNLYQFNIGKEIETLFDFFGALAEEKNISLILKGDTSNVYGDKELLRRALSNLLSNAIRHTPEGNEIEVRLADNKENGVAISMTNPGSRIPEKDLDRIFERFYRVESSRQRHSDGAGLGLAIVKSIIEAHGGSIRAFSDERQTTMKISLPNNAQI